MSKIPFNEKEMNVVFEIPPLMEGYPAVRFYDRPISYKENWRRLYSRENPVWVPHDLENVFFSPTVIPDSVARALVVSDEPFDPDTQGGGPDMYGTQWVYQPENMGSMVVPGDPRIEDMNDWKSIITRPDIDSWDWEGCAKVNADYLNGNNYVVMQLLSGWFERIISLMDFVEAAMALIDDDQKDAVHEFLDATTEDMCKIVDKVIEYLPQVDGFCVHDDWGGQDKPFFSQETAMEMIVPHMRKFTDYVHSKGMFCELHSCGHTESRIEAYIAAGWDSWCPQEMNDTVALYENYGDQIFIMMDPGVAPDATEEEQRAAAREFARRFCKPGKIALPGSPSFMLSQAFEEELYKETRRIFLEA